MSCTSPSSNPRNKPSVKKRRSHEAPSFFCKGIPLLGIPPPIFFWSCPKENGPWTVQKKNRNTGVVRISAAKAYGLLPSAPNPVPLQMVFSHMPYLSSQRGAATGWPMLLFPLPLAWCARAARSEAERAEREAGHIQPAPPDSARRITCGGMELQAPVSGALGRSLPGLTGSV